LEGAGYPAAGSGQASWYHAGAGVCADALQASVGVGWPPDGVLDRAWAGRAGDGKAGASSPQVRRHVGYRTANLRLSRHLPERRIGGRIAKLAAALVAMHDFAADEPGIAERAGRVLDVATCERRADRAGGDALAVARDRRHDVDREVVPRACGGEQVGRAGTV